MSRWNVATVTELYNWKVYEVDGSCDGSPSAIHFVGYTGHDGRVSSPVLEFDKTTMKGKTSSGGIYKLFGDSGYNANANHTFSVWLRMYDNPTFRDITAQYTKQI